MRSPDVCVYIYSVICAVCVVIAEASSRHFVDETLLYNV